MKRLILALIFPLFFLPPLFPSSADNIASLLANLEQKDDGIEVFWTTRDREKVLTVLQNQTAGKPEALIPYLKKGSAIEKSGAAIALARLDPSRISKPILPALYKLLKKRNVADQRAAVLAIASIGPDAAEAIPKMVKAAERAREEQEKKKEREHGGQDYLRADIADAIGVMGDKGAPGTAHLIEELKPRDGEAGTAGTSDVYFYASQSLVRIGKRAVPKLALALWIDDPLFRSRVARVLGAFGPEAGGAVPTLEQVLLRDDVLFNPANTEAIEEMIAALDQIDPYEAEDIKSLIQKKESTHARETFAQLILELDLNNPGDKLSPSYLTSYRRALRHPNKEVRAKAVQALALMKKDALPALRSLTRAVFDPDPEVGPAAARTIGAFGPKAKTMIPFLVESLTAYLPPETKLEVVKALPLIGELTPEQVASLFEANKDPNKEVRLAVKNYLTAIGFNEPEKLEKAIDEMRAE